MLRSFLIIGSFSLLMQPLAFAETSKSQAANVSLQDLIKPSETNIGAWEQWIDELYALTVEQAFDVQDAQLGLEKSRQLLRSSYSAFLPTLSGTSEWQDDREKNKNLDSKLVEESRFQRLSYGLEIRQNLFRGGADFHAIQRDKSRQEWARLSEAEAKEALKLAIGLGIANYQELYFESLLQESFVKESQTLLQTAERKFQAGQVGQVDVFRAKLRLARSETDFTQAKLRRDVAEQEVLATLQLQPQSEKAQQLLAKARKELMPIMSPKETTSPQEWLPLAKSQAQLKASEKDLAATKAERFLPAIDLGYRWTMGKIESELDQNSPVEFDRTNKTFFLSLNWTIWDEQTRIGLFAKSYEIAQAKLSEQKLKQTIDNESEKIKLSFNQLQLALTSQDRQVKEAEKIYQASKKLYELGLIGIIELIDAENLQLQASSSYLSLAAATQQRALQLRAMSKGYLAVSSQNFRDS